MKKFTKISLIIVAVLAGLGILFSGIAAAMGAGWTTIHREALAGTFDVGNLHFGDGVYFSDEFTSDLEDLTGAEGISDLADIANSYDGEGGNETMENTFTADEVRSLELEIDVADVIFTNTTNEDHITINLKDGFEKYFSTGLDGTTLKVKYDTKNHHYKNGATIKIALPENINLKEMKLSLGVGNVEFQGNEISCETVSLSSGVGEYDIKKLSLTGDLEIYTGTGDITIEDGSYQKVKIESGIGDIEIGGRFSGDIDVETGLGDIKATLPESENSYNYDLSSGVGEIKINNNTYSSLGAEHKVNNTDAIATVELTSGTGDIKVTTK